MNAIYEPRGKAGEYGKYAINLYKGCSHGCTYCYAPSATYATVEKFIDASPRLGILDAVKKDAASLSPLNPVFLCFTCDPYQPIDCEYQLTRETIKILHSRNIPVQILTKGGKRAERDFDLLTNRDQFGVTLTSLNNTESLLWEPNAALPGERIDTLELAHTLGIRTWVSLEPVINPDNVYEIIKLTHNFVDLYKVGKMNYHPISKAINWQEFGERAIELLQSLNKTYYIKQDLLKYVRPKTAC